MRRRLLTLASSFVFSKGDRGLGLDLDATQSNAAGTAGTGTRRAAIGIAGVNTRPLMHAAE